MPESALVTTALEWVIEKYAYNSDHLLKALEWIDQLAPHASEALRLAALTHDMERAFPGADQPVNEVIRGFGDLEYNQAHSERSARIVGEWLREQKADATLIQEVEKLIRAHEVGGWPEADLVQAADSLSFLDTNVDLFLNMARSGKRSLEEIKLKLDYTYERIQVPQARDIALPKYIIALARLTELQAELKQA